MRLCSERGEPPRVLELRVRLCTARCNRGLFKGPTDVALLSSPRRGKGGPARTDKVAPMIEREHAGERARRGGVRSWSGLPAEVARSGEFLNRADPPDR